MVMTLQQLQALLLTSAARVNAETARIVTKSSDNVNKDAIRNARASSGTSAAGYPDTMSYEVRNLGTRVEGEIGPEARGLGNIGHILEGGSAEYGGVKNPPHRDLGRAADTEEPRFISAMEQIGNVVL